jgi:uncharacterized protein (DUF983 family)
MVSLYDCSGLRIPVVFPLGHVAGNRRKQETINYYVTVRVCHSRPLLMMMDQEYTKPQWNILTLGVLTVLCLTLIKKIKNVVMNKDVN